MTKKKCEHCDGKGVVEQKEKFCKMFMNNPTIWLGGSATEPAGGTDAHVPYDEPGAALKNIFAYKGETIAAALIAKGYRDFRYTHRFNLPRGFFCGVGQCTDCSMIVNGVPNIRTCVTRVEKGMIIETQYGYGD